MSEVLAQFGETLRATREDLGLSLQDVAHRTRIPLNTLRQLEDDNYSLFPSPAYARSFLAQYTEHLGLDAADWLDQFETGDVLANLEAYEYLKDHHERIGTAPLPRKREKAPQSKTRKETAPRGRHANALQPLLVFSASAAIVTGAIFGFMKLSDQLDGDEEVATLKPPGENLGPVSGLLESPPRTLDVTNAPAAIPVEPGIAASPENLVEGVSSGPKGPKVIGAGAPPPEEGASPFSFEGAPPPRAVIVEE